MTIENNRNKSDNNYDEFWYDKSEKGAKILNNNVSQKGDSKILILLRRKYGDGINSGICTLRNAY